MAESNKVKVVGYAQRTFYNDGIEYRNFSDDLVGNQLTENSDGESSVFTFGNFVTTTNYAGKTSRIFSTKKFSNFYTLDNYGLTVTENETLLNNNVNVVLNLDTTDLCNFAYFGSATEFIRVSLENIITNWPASLYVKPLRTDGINTIVGNTVSNYSYDPVTNKSTFDVDVNFIDNKYDINFLKNGTVINTFNEGNRLRNLSVSYLDFVIFVNDKEYSVIGFTGANSITNDTIGFEVQGDPFGFNGNIDAKTTYHIKPNKTIVDGYFNSLDTYENNLLNRLTLPKYTSTYKYKKEEDDGTITLGEEILTWPVSDGYNIDYDTPEYLNFVEKLLLITQNKDSIETDLMTRFLTADAISEFDTIPNCEGGIEETAGQKMNRTLKIYGREFDEIKKYIDGISFANVVTYDKKENTPDQLVKYLARVLGWELTSSIIENDLIKSYLNVGARSYAGHSRGLTPAEAEVELWRRLILNSSWIWKSKGTRKAIEFFFKLIGTPDGLIEFDEHVYVAKEPIDMNLFYKVLENNGLDNDLSLYNVDDEGYPKFFRDTPSMYFQKGGQWYRETGGERATEYTLVGNNPHVGPYDSGKEYINQLENIIPTFTPFTLTSTTITTGTTQLFTNYNSGIINKYTGSTYIGLQNDNGININGYVTTETSIIQDPFPQIEYTDCGCDIPEDDEALKVYVKKNSTFFKQVACEEIFDGQFAGFIYDPDNKYYSIKYRLKDINGNILPDTYKVNKFVNPECCNAMINTSLISGGISLYHEEYVNTGLSYGTASEIKWELVNCGYICGDAEQKYRDFGGSGVGCYLSCQWLLAGTTLGEMETIGSQVFLKFIDPKGDYRVVNEADSCFCPAYYTEPEIVQDPYTNKIGYGCRLTDFSNNNFGVPPGGKQIMLGDSSENNILFQLFKQRATGVIPCSAQLTTGL